MSEVIDSKVVELKFNNAEFEKNVKTSLTTIEKLKKSLNFDTVTTSVNLLQNAFQLKGLKNIQAQLGQVVGAVDKSVSPIMATINTIGNAITNTIGGAITGVVNQIKTGGMNRAMNVEKAKFALQGLKIEWDDVKDSISDAVTGTAYGMDAAARAASVLAGSGIDYKKVIGKDLVDTDVELTQMGMVLKSISGVATQTNQDFEQMAHIFSTIAGNGRLMGMQLSQLSQYGMNAAADIGDAIGKTDAEVRDLVSKGEISADKFFEIMYKKYWANAKKANDTLDGVSRNIRATYSRIGEAFYAPLIENEGPIVKMLGAYKDVIGVVANRLKAPGTKLKDGEGNKLTTYVTRWLIKDINLVTKFLTDIKNNGDVIKAWRAVYRVLKSGFKIFQMTFNFVRSIGMAIKQAFPESFLDYWIDINTHIFKFVNIFYKGSKNIKKNANTMSKAFKGIRGVLEPIYENVKNLTDAFKQFFDETFDGIDPLQTVVDTISDLCGYLHVGIVETEDWRKGFDALWGIVKHVYGVFKAFGEAVYETFKEGHFHPIKFIIDLLHTLTDGIVSNDKKTNKLKNTFKIFTTIIGVVAKVFGAALLIVAKVFNILFKIGGWILNITSPIGTLVSKIFELVTGFTDAARNIDLDKYEALQKVIEGIKDFFGGAKDAVEKFSEKVSDFTENQLSKIEVDWPGAFDKVLDVLNDIADKAGKVKDKITNGVGKALDELKISIDNTFGSDSQTKMSGSKDILEKISKINILGGIGKGIETLGKAIGKFFDYIKDSPLLSQMGEDMKNFFSGLGEDISNNMDMSNAGSSIEGIANIFGIIGLALSKIFEAVGTVIKSFTDNVLNYGSSTQVKNIINEMIETLGAFTLFNWSAAFLNFSKIVTGGATPMDRFTKFFNTVATVMESLGKSALMIAGALYIINSIAGDAQFDKAVEVFAGFMAGITLIAVYFMGKNRRIGGWDVSLTKSGALLNTAVFAVGQIVPLIFALSIAMLAVAGALKIMDGIDSETMNVGWLILITSLTAISIAAGVLANSTQVISTKGAIFNRIAPIIKGIGIALLLVAASIWVLGQVPTDRLDPALEAMLKLLAAMLAIITIIMIGGSAWSAAAKTSAEMPTTISAISLVIGAIAGSLFTIAKALTIMALIPENILNKGMSNLITVMLMLGAFIATLLVASKGLGGKKTAITMGSIAGGILAIAVSCLLLSVAMAAFAVIPWKGIVKGLAAIGGALLILLGAAALVKIFKLDVAMDSINLTLITIAGTVALVSFSIWLLVKAFIALGKEGPAAVAGAAAFFYAIGAGIGKLIEGLVSVLGSICESIWTGIQIIGEFIIEKVPEIIIWLGKLTVMLMEGLGKVIGPMISPLLSKIFGNEDEYKLYEGNISEALKNEIVNASKDIQKEQDNLRDKLKVKDNDFDYYEKLWKRLQDITTESGRVKTGYENEAKEIIEELNPALDLNMEYQDGQIKGYKKIRKNIEKTIELKKAEAYIEASREQYQNDLQKQIELTDKLAEAKEKLNTSETDKTTNEGYIKELENLNAFADGGVEKARETFKEIGVIFDQSTGQFVDYSDELFDSMLSATGGATTSLQIAIDSSLAYYKEKQKDIEEVVDTEKGIVEEAEENLGAVTARINNFDRLETQITEGNAAKAEETMLKMKHGFQTANDTTKEALEKQTENYKEELAKYTKLLAGDKHNELYKKNCEEYKKLIEWSRAEVLKERGKTDEEIQKDIKESQNAQAETQRQIYEANEKRIEEEHRQTRKRAKKNAKDTANAEKEGLDEAYSQMDFTNIEKMMKQDGIDTGKYFPEGINEGCDFTSILPSMKADGINIGEYFGDGFIEGVANKIGGAFDVGELLGNAGADGTTTALDEHSPSRVMMKNGRYFVEGFVNGIKNSIPTAASTTKNLAQTVIDSFNSMALDSDYSPTITPVVDLSNVNSAAGSINGLFGNRSIGLSSNIGAVSASMREIQNTDKNAGLIAAINGLNGTTNNNVYNVNGITYDDGSNIADAVGQLINAAMIERRM